MHNPKPKEANKETTQKADPKITSVKRISVTNLYQLFGERSPNQSSDPENDKVVVHMDTTLFVKPGETVCLLGRENSGVSSVLLTIMEET